MKKIILSLVMMFTAMVGANAQYAVDGNNALDNWSVGVEGGISTNLHDWNAPQGATVGIQLTKQITPVVAFEFSTNLGFNDNANWLAPHSKNGIDNLTAMASTKINLMNWFCGYTGTPRLFEIQARGGVGYMKYFYPDAQGDDVNRCVSKMGLDFDFNVGQEKAWTLSVRPAVILKAQNDDWTPVEHCSKYSHNAVGQLTAGVTYHFKTSNGKHHFTEMKPVEVTRYVEKIIEKPVDKIVEKEVIKTVTDTVTIEKITSANAKSYMVNFASGSSELDAKSKEILDGVDAKTAAIVAFASPDGNAEKNQILSQKRADTVAEYLKAKGVEVVSSKGGGVSGPNSGRLAIITAE